MRRFRPFVSFLRKAGLAADQPARDPRALSRGRLELPTGLVDVRIHDLRHSFASGAVALGLSLPMIGKLLGHTQVQTTARYAHLAADPVKAAAERVSSNIAAVMSGQSAEVALLEALDRVK